MRVCLTFGLRAFVLLFFLHEHAYAVSQLLVFMEIKAALLSERIGPLCSVLESYFNHSNNNLTLGDFVFLKDISRCAKTDTLTAHCR